MSMGYNNSTVAANATFSPLHDTCDTPTSILNIAYVAYLIVVITVNVVGNMFVLTVIFLSPSLRKQTTNIFLASLSVADISMGLISFPIRMKVSLDNQLFCMPIHVCWFHFITDTLLSISSITHLFIIALDRFVAIKFTYFYHEFVTQKKITITLIIIWMYSSIWGFLLVFNWEDFSKKGVSYQQSNCLASNNLYFLNLYIFVFFIPMVTMIFTYSYVYATVVRHIKALVANEIFATSSEKHKLRKQKETKALRSVVYVFAAYIICWAPSICIAFSTMTDNGKLFWQKVYLSNPDVFHVVDIIALRTLPPLNSTLNPFIYVLWNKQYREALKLLYRKLRYNNEELCKTKYRRSPTYDKDTDQTKNIQEIGTTNVRYVKGSSPGSPTAITTAL